MPSLNDDLFDSAVRHQIGLTRYSTSTVRKILALLNRVDDDLVAKIKDHDPDAVSGAWSGKRIEKLIAALRVLNREAYTVVGKELRAELIDLAEYEVEYQSAAFASASPVDLRIKVPNREVLKAAVDSRPFQGALLKEWVSGLEEGRARRLRDAVRIGFVQGETVDQIVDRVRGTKALNYRDGVLDISRRSAEAMVRTAVNHTATRAREDLYSQNTDLIKGVRWVATLDSRTTAVCRGRDGIVYEVNKGPRPPAHIGCRSTTICVTKTWREMGIDIKDPPVGIGAKIDGGVPAAPNYGDWLRRQPKAVQDEVLGKAKGQLFRKGGLTMDRFIDTTGAEYTLDELRRREKQAFEKAGLAA
jgi:SPP1 gp7 family putative phage head morphogenesis protein